jgi:hypothetical protein
VRYGTTPPYRLVIEDEVPVLRDDAPEQRQTYGHLVTLEWAESGTDLMSQVSPFNHIRYRVSLARSFGSVLRPIQSGHLFNIETRRIIPLFGTRLFIP